MKALTLMQPWATLVALGAKRIETRSWNTHYRGPLAIHAARNFPAWAQEFLGEEPFESVLRPFFRSFTAVPVGCVVATARLVNVMPVEVVDKLGEQERAFGDYSPGRYAWMLEDVRPLPEPVSAIGALGLWDWDFVDAEVAKS